MCAEGRVDETPFGRRILTAENSDAYLMKKVHQPGYAVVIWRGRHVAEPTELEDWEAAAFWHDVLRVGRAILGHYGAAKMNYQVLGNALPHLHAHVVARFVHDRSPGQPFFGPAIHELRPDALDRDVTQLAAVLARL
jgi:diadenosine tetraphosphate (Ap4A) HIT family hydrolase